MKLLQVEGSKRTHLIRGSTSKALDETYAMCGRPFIGSRVKRSRKYVYRPAPTCKRCIQLLALEKARKMAMSEVHPFVPDDAFPLTSALRWLTKEEQAMFKALCCRDISHSMEVSVIIHNEKGKKVDFRKFTPEQAERSREASEMLYDRYKLLCADNLHALFCNLARERALRAGLGLE